MATAAVATEPFRDEALEQARLLGMPDYRLVFVPHPVQLLTLDELNAFADRAFEEIVLLAAGGEAGRYSALLGPCLGMDAAIVSRAIVD